LAGWPRRSSRTLRCGRPDQTLAPREQGFPVLLAFSPDPQNLIYGTLPAGLLLLIQVMLLPRIVIMKPKSPD
jgi:hypothetical protein